MSNFSYGFLNTAILGYDTAFLYVNVPHGRKKTQQTGDILYLLCFTVFSICVKRLG